MARDIIIANKPQRNPIKEHVQFNNQVERLKSRIHFSSHVKNACDILRNEYYWYAERAIKERFGLSDRDISYLYHRGWLHR